MGEVAAGTNLASRGELLPYDLTILVELLMTFVDYLGRMGLGKLDCSAFLASQCSVPLDSPPKPASDAI